MQQSPITLIVPAAGLGTRMKAVEPKTPKEMLPVAGRPAIQYAVDEGVAAGITHIAIVIGPHKDTIRRYFEDAAFAAARFPEAVAGLEKVRRLCRLSFVRQETPTGDADALACAAEVAGGGPVCVVYPDHLHLPAPGALAVLTEAFEACAGDVIGLMDTRREAARTHSDSGHTDLAPAANNEGLYRVLALPPKGPDRFVPRFQGELMTCFGFVAGPHLFDCIERARRLAGPGEFTVGPMFDLLLKERPLFGRLLPGDVYDLGEPDGYRAAVAAAISV